MKKCLLAVIPLFIAFAVSAQTSPTYISGKIPIDSNRWYQMDNVSSGLGPLFNGITDEVVNTGYGKVLSNYDSYYPLLDGEVMNIDSIRLFDGQGSNPGQPWTLSVITTGWQRIPIASFNGDTYMTWVGPYPDSVYGDGTSVYKLDSTIVNPRYLVINTDWAYPSEVELYGTYLPPTQVFTPYVHKPVQLRQTFGANGFEWNFEDGNDPQNISEPLMNMVKSFTGVRHYMDWEKLEPNEDGYTFNPCHSGGWNYDTIYTRCKAENIEVLADLKTLPDWMIATYPAADQDAEDVPLRYGSDFSDPNSYHDQAQVAFQYAARYGSNADVPDSLMHIDSTQRWFGDPINVIKKGLNLIKYIECDNERDKWWKGVKGYQTGRQYAANLSAFYDGNMNTMGPGFGVKNADPNMQVVMCGLASPSTDYVRGMIDWCKEHRGYKANGQVNLCWDVINYHLYTDNSNSTQSGTASRGAAPEVSAANKYAQAFLQMAHDYAYDMPVWVTEAGYDINQGSPYHAIAIGNKTVEQTQADWILRTSLFYARMGIERVFYYEMYDDNAANPTQFASSGLINDDHTRRPVADFMYQANKLMGEYTYQQTISNNPLVDRYALNGRNAYALTMPTENGSTATYLLNLGNADSAAVYTPTPGQDSMAVVRMATTGGLLQLTITETPVFVIPDSVNTIDTSSLAIRSEDPAFGTLQLYPNPTASRINLQLSNSSTDVVTVTISNSIGQHVKTLSYAKPGALLTAAINLRDLSAGLYLFTIQQGSHKAVRKVTRSN